MTGINGCADTVSQQVQVHPVIVAAFTTSGAPYCVGSEVTFTDLSTANPGAWAWSFGDGSTSTAQNPTHSYSDSGTYIVQLAVADNFCGSGQISLPVTVYFIPDPELRGDTLLCPNEVFVLTSNAEGTSFLWSTGETTPVVTLLAPQQTTIFTVTVDNNGCKGTDSVLITIDCIFQLPSAFSPNSDGSNDVLHPLGSHVSQYTMAIYNRWGQEVYNRTSNNLLEGWDGKLDGQPQGLGVYVYTVNGTFVSGEAFTQTGNITLVR
jgi:gliding motility-associated-like protein